MNLLWNALNHDSRAHVLCRKHEVQHEHAYFAGGYDAAFALRAAMRQWQRAHSVSATPYSSQTPVTANPKTSRLAYRQPHKVADCLCNLDMPQSALWDWLK